MDYKAYRDAYFTDPAPQPRYAYQGIYGATLYFRDYEAAVKYYKQVLGPPAYSEGKSTKGWQLGETWLTLLRSREDNPRSVEIQIVMGTVEEADRLQQAFIDAGGVGQVAHDGLMYEPVHMCPVTDPFGTEILITCKIEAP